ncbi:MAG: exopolysaccharide transport family protein, partial [Hyphomicrobium aestuarii]|nr:exopolysaccharide transport family protein [Hyphomicrobium aestuarii]
MAKFPVSSPASPDDIDTVTLAGRVMGAIPRIAIAALAVGVATFGVLSMMAPRFQSEAQLTIEAKMASSPFADPKQAGASPDNTAPRMDKEAINTHIGALRSPALAAEIVEKLGLAQQPEFNPASGDVDWITMVMRRIGLGGTKPGQSEQDRVLEAYFSNLQVFAARESRFIQIRFTSVNPNRAAEIPNAIAEAYRAQLAGRQVEETQDVQDALAPKLAQLVTDVATAEMLVDQFRGKIDAFKSGTSGSQQQSLSEQQLGELTNELSRAQAARSEAEARAQSGRELLKGGSGEVLPDVQRSPLIQNLVQQRVRVERQIAELNATLLPGHPRMQQLNADLAGLKKQITAEVAKVVDGLAREAKVAADREASINKRLATLKIKVVDKGPDEAKLKGLVADAKSKRDELERLQGQFNANKSRVESKAVPVEAKIVSAATPSSVPVFPKKGPLSGMTALATFVLGLALTVLRGIASGARSGPVARHQPTLNAPKPVRPMHVGPTHVSAASAATVPARYSAPADLTMAEPEREHERDSSHGPVLSIAALIERIGLRTPERGGYRSLVTGTSVGSHGTATAIALARGLADLGQPVIIVEWTYGQSVVSHSLSVPDHPGTAELISGDASFEDVISGLPGTKCHAITAGRSLMKAFAKQDPDQINLVLDALDEAYAHIVVTGEHDAVRQLFEAIEGRFDAGILVNGPGAGTIVRDEKASFDGTFLGFEVADIDVIHYHDMLPPKAAGS